MDPKHLPGYLQLADAVNPLTTAFLKLTDLAETYPADERVWAATEAINRAAEIIGQCVSIWMSEQGKRR